MDNKEKRTYQGSIEIRKKDDGTESRTIEGYAAVFDAESLPMGWFEDWTEKIDKDAFSEVLEDTDTRALFNHDSNLVLARVPNTLKLSVDERGLKYEFEAPNTTTGNDLLEMVKRGDISQSSFGFTVKEQKWTYSDDKNLPSVRTILKVEKLYDVSPVTWPAYPDTTVAKRSIETEQKPTEEEILKLEETQKAEQRQKEMELNLGLKIGFKNIPKSTKSE